MSSGEVAGGLQLGGMVHVCKARFGILVSVGVYIDLDTGRRSMNQHCGLLGL